MSPEAARGCDVTADGLPDVGAVGGIGERLVASRPAGMSHPRFALGAAKRTQLRSAWPLTDAMT